MEIKILQQQGKSIRKISRLMGVSRNTVRKYLRDALSEPHYQERPVKKSKLDPYKDYIKNRLAAAKPNWIPAVVIKREIQDLGYSGGITTLRSYMYTLKPEQKVEPLIRFETQPGQQMQVDWCVIRRGHQSMSAFVATLGYSRATYVEFVKNEQFETFKQCHENAFDFFQGVPLEILYDNMKTVVTQRNAYGEGQHRFHRGLWQLAKDYGFNPRLCQPYRAQTKGKVERFIHYLRYSFFILLTAQLKQIGLDLDVETANIEVRRWLRDVAHQRVHGTVNESPVDRLKHERQHLQGLPAPLLAKPSMIKSVTAMPISTVYPIEHLQRSPSIYDQLLHEVSA